jgi:hypothetical protein
VLDIKKPLEFSISRQDLLYSFAASLGEVFLFSTNAASTPSNEPGVHLLEDEGFDFVGECSPAIVIKPCKDILEKETGLNASDLMISISLEDIALGTREIIYELPVVSVTSSETRVFNLKTFSNMAFLRGFELRCLITRSVTVPKTSSVIWNKSQVIFERAFSARTTSDDALFEISWMNFNLKDEFQNLLYYVKWDSYDVSGSPSTDCFEVIANEALRLQFKRLENNSHFGHFAVRLIAQDILRELVLTCLRYAEPGGEPLPDSLHEKVKALLDSCSFPFEDALSAFKSGEPMTVLNVQSDLNRLIQRIHLIGGHLSGMRFGGYRAL